jgi:hypothetical protein
MYRENTMREEKERHNTYEQPRQEVTLEKRFWKVVKTLNFIHAKPWN